MKRTLLIIGFFMSFGWNHAQQSSSKQLSAKFDSVLTGQFKAGEPGATALVAKNGKIIYKKAFGLANLELGIPMQPENVFRIGSITKQFTAVAILQLMEQGKLNLDDELVKFLPDYPVHGHKITIEHLLTHTSGIQSFTGMKDYMERMALDLTPEEVIDHFKYQPMKFAPGTKWEYNNSGYFLLGFIIEKITGMSYGEYVEENIFRPAGMTNSLYGSNTKIIKNRAGMYTKNENGFENALTISMTQPYAAGSIQSTVEDLYKWNQALHSFKIIKKESLEKAFTRYKLSDGKETDYGYGWQLAYIQKSKAIEHGGGINGSLTFAVYLPEEDVFVAVFSSCECAPPESIAVQLAALAIGKPYEFKEITLEGTLMENYTGVYENKDGELRQITFSENKLYSQRGRNPKFEIKAYAKDKFFFDDAMLTIEFIRDDKDGITKLITVGRNGNETWEKTDKPFLSDPEIKLDEKILELYTGEYEISPDFTFVVSREHDQLFVQATGQDKFEIYPEAETRFFAKVTDAQFEFVKDINGKVIKTILKQGGREIEAKKIK